MFRNLDSECSNDSETNTDYVQKEDLLLISISILAGMILMNIITTFKTNSQLKFMKKNL